MEHIIDIITNAIVDIVEVSREAVKPETHLAQDLGADSLHEVEICMAIEERLNITVEDNHLENIKTVQDWIDYLEMQGFGAAKA